DVDGAGDRPAHSAGEADDHAGAITDGTDAVQGTLDAGAVVVAEGADARDHVVDVLVCDLQVVEDHLPTGEPRLGLTAEVEHDLENLATTRRQVTGGVRDPRRESVDEELKLLVPVLTVRTHLDDDVELLETVHGAGC